MASRSALTAARAAAARASRSFAPLSLARMPAATAATRPLSAQAVGSKRCLAPAAARGFATTRSQWDDVEDVDLDSVAYGFMASQALFTGLEIGIYDIIDAAGPDGADIAHLRQQCIDAPRLQTLLTALTAVKCLRRSAEGRYTLSPNTARYMVKSSRHFYGDYLQHQIGKQFYRRMADLPEVMTTGKAPSYASWFSDPEVAKTYTTAQHNGSVATAKYLIKKKLDLGGISSMLDVGGGSGAFSYVFVEAAAGLKSTVLELPEVCRTGESIRAEQPEEVRSRVNFVELDATSPDWPVADGSFDLVLMSYISGSVPEPIIAALYSNAFKALRSGGRLIVHDFMASDTLDKPALGALWGLQHVTVNADGLGLTSKEVISRMVDVGFDASTCTSEDMIKDMTKLIVARKS